MIRWLRSIFAWKAVRNTGVWLYYENDITGRRRAVKIMDAHQPLDRSFLRKGDSVISPWGSYVIGEQSEIIHG